MKDFKKYFLIPAAREQVYLALTSAPTLQLWTGEAAEMSITPGSEFSLWEGSITGINLEFEENSRIVQEWFFGEQPETSVVTIKLFDDPKGTSMEVRHVNIPDEDFDDITEGWKENYAANLIAFFEED